jgi:hypothetical protein
MATINGRYVKLTCKPGEPIGRVSGWREDSDWIKVECLDGSSEMIHYTDSIEVLPAAFDPSAQTETK